MNHRTHRRTRAWAAPLLALTALLITVTGTAQAMLPAPIGVGPRAPRRPTTTVVPIDGQITAGQWIVFAASIAAALAVGAVLMQVALTHRHRFA